ncbi:MAG: hypothetical protein E7668_00445 [Ruminococcaceae bacterium]|nr:hypothetical protein [Oscillospiraceae bacterium]
MMLSLADLHCDTLYELFAKNQSPNDRTLAVRWNDTVTSVYRFYLQIAAIWCADSLSDEQAFQQCLSILERLENHPFSKLLCRSDAVSSLQKPISLFLAVEDARLLAQDIDRLAVLRQKGIRFLTLLWKGCSCIGGAYDTETGLTDFGKQVVKRCTELGIVPDISHASLKSAQEIIEEADGHPVIASHSNAFQVFPHPRNLNDSLFDMVRSSGGLVGINLYVQHLGSGHLKGTETEIILRHIDHFLSLDGENTLCFGCDFDGAETPNRYQHPEDLYRLADYMLHIGYTETLIQKLFWKNAESFIIKNIINNRQKKG